MKVLAALADRVRQSLERSRTALSGGLNALLSLGRPLDEALFEDLEELLISADLGSVTAREFVERLREDVRRGRLGAPEDVRSELKRFLEEVLATAVSPLTLDQRPAVILVLGVNGSGKTTTCGKLAAALKGAGKSVALAAADTFRAAAVDQLRVWADRVGVPVVAHGSGADPGAVVYDALDAAVARGIELVLVDTAGRLHTKTNLMDELAKIDRIVGRRLPGLEPDRLLVLDATTGQNGLAQAAAFDAAVGLTGVVLTKLDSTSRGGIVFAIESTLGVPVRYVGVGEGTTDLLPFEPDAFVAALFDGPAA